jgi:hypothetical protein
MCMALAVATGVTVAGCGSTVTATLHTPTVRITAIPSAAHAASAELLDWPEFGLNPVSSPIADPDRLFVYAASPDGLIHKLSLADGSEDTSGSWPVSITREALHEKLGAALNTDDLDLGSSAPALLGEGRVVLAGKDGIMRVLALSRLDGHPPSGARLHPLGGEVQRLSIPGGGELFTAPAVWRRGGRTTTFIADEHATAAYVLRHGRLYQAWQNSTPGTSPVMAGGLLYVYEPDGGGIYVYRPSSPHPIAKLSGEAGHWNSPIVVDGHVVEPEGNANAHELSGRLEIFSAG